jgi:hypothetical protein
MPTESTPEPAQRGQERGFSRLLKTGTSRRRDRRVVDDGVESAVERLAAPH